MRTHQVYTSGGPALFEERSKPIHRSLPLLHHRRPQQSGRFCLRQRPNEGQTNYWWKSSLFKLKTTHYTLPPPLGVLKERGTRCQPRFQPSTTTARPHRTHTYSPSLKSEQAPKPLSLSSLSPHSETKNETLILVW